MKLLRDKTQALILAHYYIRKEGAGDTDERLLNYLKERVKKVVLIANPFPESNSDLCFCFVYENGRKIHDFNYKILAVPNVLKYLYQAALIYFILFKIGSKYDLCISLENFSFFVVYPLRLISIINRMIYYSIDLVPNRFPNKIIDSIYHFVYRFVCKHSDRNWVMAKEQIIGSKSFGVTTLNSSPFSLVPIGYEAKKIKVLPTEKIDFYKIVYMGNLIESHGPQLAIEALPLLIKKLPVIHLTIIGGGRYNEYLKSLAKRLKVKKYVNFTGFIEKFQDLTNLLVTKSIGLAPYKPVPGSFSYFSDPSKIKLYMCCGLPVVTTDVTTMAPLIKKSNSGRVIHYSKEYLAKEILYLLSDKKRYQVYKEAATKLSKKFDINNILDSAIKEIPD